MVHWKLLTLDFLPNVIADKVAPSHSRHGMPKVDNYEAVPSMQIS